MSKTLKKPNPSARFVDSQAGLDDACSDLASCSRFAFDAEFVAEDAYGSELCLLQVATDNEVWIIDPLAGVDVSAFWSFVTDPAKVAIVHAGAEDLALCFQETGQIPQNVFDLQIAAGFVSTFYPISLQKLIRGELGLQLHKSQTLTNWRKRPLSPKQMQYAIEDVAYMLPIYDRLQDKLNRLGRVPWVAEEHQKFHKPTYYQQEDNALFSNIKGIGALSRKGLAIARELAKERDRMAREYNRPPRGVLKDYLLVAIARHGWTKPEDIRSLRGLSLRREGLARLTEAVQRALDQPPESWPTVKRTPEETPGEAALTKLVSAVLQDHSQREMIASQLLGTNRDVRDLVRHVTRPSETNNGGALNRGWRRDAMGQLIDDVLEGKRAIRVAIGTDGPALVIE